MNNRSEPPWILWKDLSTKAESLDTINSSCGHTFYRPPYTIDYLIKSKVSLKDTCLDRHCQAIDEFKFESDILHQPKFQPKPIRAVNRNLSFVLNRQGIMQGPFTHSEWLEYSWKLWDNFHEVIENDNPWSEKDSVDNWSTLFFRHTDDFNAGNYNLFSGMT